jgi:hypothetical protein
MFILFRISYIYCTDTILDREKQEALELTNQSLQRLAEDRAARSSPRRPDPQPAPREPINPKPQTSTPRDTPRKTIEAERG